MPKFCEGPKHDAAGAVVTGSDFERARQVTLFQLSKFILTRPLTTATYEYGKLLLKFGFDYAGAMDSADSYNFLKVIETLVSVANEKLLAFLIGLLSKSLCVGDGKFGRSGQRRNHVYAPQRRPDGDQCDGPNCNAYFVRSPTKSAMRTCSASRQAHDCNLLDLVIS